MNKLEIFDDLMLFWDDPRIPRESTEGIKKLPFTTIFNYNTLNTYICNINNSIKRETRAYMRIMKARGKNISFHDAWITIIVKKLNHETMHKILYKTINKEASVLYDKLLNGSFIGKNTFSQTNYSDDTLP